MAGGLPRAPEGTGQRNPETAVFGSGCRAHRARQCFSPVGGLQTMPRDGEGRETARGARRRGAVENRGAKNGGNDLTEGFYGVKGSGSSERE